MADLNDFIEEALYLLESWERGADVDEYVMDIWHLRQIFDVYKKSKNVNTSEKRVYEEDISDVHNPEGVIKMNKDIMFSFWYDSLEGTKSQGFAYKAWCAGWDAANQVKLIKCDCISPERCDLYDRCLKGEK